VLLHDTVLLCCCVAMRWSGSGGLRLDSSSLITLPLNTSNTSGEEGCSMCIAKLDITKAAHVSVTPLHS
jgi:hypothetical protein